eukprot:TRINITY_DN1076_c0_g2_i1.p1 TRINITY_DN1076_c0_g2~~TRINITY_DN1076_c0_g2_i1.p1  ORF type:complete len:369 (+),score=169.73 TRINITY_DN1076_c0_g2_i1:56-1162(+)
MAQQNFAADFSSIPIIDIKTLVEFYENKLESLESLGSLESLESLELIAQQIGNACREVGFFYIINHGVDNQSISKLFSLGHQFFEQSIELKNSINMKNNPIFRGYFEVGGELTSLRPDHKEGLYFGAELDSTHPLVIAKTPMHGPNLWPTQLEFKEFPNVVLNYMSELTKLGHILMTGIGLSLGLKHDFFSKCFTSEPFTPFRLFYYPSDPIGTHEDGIERWGVGKHTDYGVLTILAQDNVGGLQVQNRKGDWIEAPPVPNSFIVNIGDMLEIWVKGYYTATPHRVKNIRSEKNRLSVPFFFDPPFDALITPLDLNLKDSNNNNNNNNSTNSTNSKNYDKPIHYGSYILQKVQNNFPELVDQSHKINQ